MFRSLRARLLAAIAVVAVLSVALAVAIGAALTRREIERTTLRDLSAQADLLASRERQALLPFSRSAGRMRQARPTQVRRIASRAARRALMSANAGSGWRLCSS